MVTDFPPVGRLPDSVWSHIFSFSLLGHGLGEWNKEEGPRCRKVWLSGRPDIRLLLVSKWFKVRSRGLAIRMCALF